MRPKYTVGFSGGSFADRGTEPDIRKTIRTDKKILNKWVFKKPDM